MGGSVESGRADGRLDLCRSRGKTCRVNLGGSGGKGTTRPPHSMEWEGTRDDEQDGSFIGHSPKTLSGKRIPTLNKGLQVSSYLTWSTIVEQPSPGSSGRQLKKGKEGGHAHGSVIWCPCQKTTKTFSSNLRCRGLDQLP